MSKEDEFDNKKNLWNELSKAMNSLPKGTDYDSSFKTESDPDLLEGAKELKRLFDSYVEAGFTSTQALRFIAELVAAMKD